MVVLTLGAAVIATSGCATKKYVKEETAAVGTRVDQVEGNVEKAQGRLDDHERKIGDVGKAAGNAQASADQASKTAQEALQRAQEAGKLAQGKLLYETVLTDEKVKFGFNAAKISEGAQAALDEFASQLKNENKNVYIEIQGHTDNVGSPKYNESLGEQRAEAVRLYLNQKYGFPLHRMNVISYGETAPIADNKSREGRSQNRRVALVVLQ
jgi:outer membrane protein OmpA-like peptidoglycan-associated protein